MPKRFLVLDLATGTIDAAVTAAVQAAVAASVAANITKLTVANQAARYALTQAQVQNGDYVYQTDTATLYEVIDQTLLNGASGYVALATVTAAQISDATVAGRALLTAASLVAQLTALGGGTAPTGTGALVRAISPTFTGTTLAANIQASGTVIGSNLSGTNTGDQTITLTGDVTGSGRGSFAVVIGAGRVTNAMLAGAIAAAKLVGTDITIVGTITQGTWHGAIIDGARGGTGVANNGKTITVSGNTVLGSGSDALTLQTSGDTQLQLPASGRLGTSSVLLTNHQALNGTTLVTGVKYGVRQDGYNSAYAYLPTDATVGDVIELEDIEGQWGHYSFTLYASGQYLNDNWYGSLVCVAPFSRVRALYRGNDYWTVSVDDPGKFTEITWDGNSSLYPVAGDRWSMTYPASYYIYLPGGGSEGDEILIRDGGGNWSSYGIWLYGYNTYLNGSWWGNFYSNTNGATIRCVYGYDSSIGQLGWKVALEGSTGDSVWTEDSSGTNYFYPQAGQRFVFTYTSPWDTLYAYLPSSPGVGDEIWIADGGRNWSVYPLVISANAPTNGNWSGFTTSTRWSLVRCVYLGGSIGWSITESGVSRDAWQTAAGGSLYPSLGDRLNLIYSSTAYVYLPSSASEGDEILIRDAGNHWASYGIYVYGANTYLNGGWWNNFYCTASGATIRCVYGYDSSIGTWGWIVGVGSTESWVKVSDSAQRVFSGCRYLYAPVSGGFYVNLPYGYSWQRKPGDEILLADPGQTWGTYPFYIQMPNGYGGGDMINGASVPFYVDRPGGKIHCVYVDDNTGWTVGYADEGQWRTGIDSSFTLYPNGRYSCAFSSPQTLTLPSPDYQNLKPGDEILIEDAGTPGSSGWGTNTLTLDCSNQNINGTAGNKTVTTDGAAVRCVWVGGGTGWSVKTLPGTVL